MKIQIELLIAGIICLMLFMWFVWYKLSKWIAGRKYKPENNKGKKGGIEKLENGKENKRGELGRGAGETESRKPDVIEPPQHAEQTLCDAASPVPNRKNRNSIRGIFKSLRRR
ncbi:MAG: hypothetical protein KAQ92_03970 [Candidatus Aenigmarchaeota archaeon]|nr:hypothetical protein [Candidatus Aenigmarchaeota archaeon]